MSAAEIWIMIIGVSIVSLLPRILPVALLSRMEFSEAFKEWLSYIAPAVLGALAALSVIAPNGQIDFHASNLYLWAAIPTIIVAVRTRSLFYSLTVGIVSMALLYNFV